MDAAKSVLLGSREAMQAAMQEALILSAIEPEPETRLQRWARYEMLARLDQPRAWVVIGTTG